MSNPDLFRRLMVRYGQKDILGGFIKLKGARVAVIGTSPVSLVAANIWCSMGALVTIFEKEISDGGAWATFLNQGRSYPISTHIIMPNQMSREILIFAGANSKSWGCPPVSINLDTGHIGSFPDAKSSQYGGRSYDYTYNDAGLANDLLRALDSTKVRFHRKKVDLVDESHDRVSLVDSSGEARMFEYVFLTPATVCNFTLRGETSNIRYHSHKNRSIVYDYSGDTGIGSAFFHLDGPSPVREIQLYDDVNDRTTIVAKLSRFGKFSDHEWIIKTLDQVLPGRFRKDFATVRGETIYENTRMDLESQDYLMQRSKRISMPYRLCSEKGKGEIEERYRFSQDISLILNSRDFYGGLAFIGKR